MKSVSLIVFFGLLFFQAFLQEDTLKFTLEGIVVESETKIPLENALVEVKAASGELIETESDSNGVFRVDLKPESSYTILIFKDQFLNAKGNETTIGEIHNRVFFHEYGLKLNTTHHYAPVIFFQEGSLAPIDSFFFYSSIETDFNVIASYLNDNPSLRFTIYGLQNQLEPEGTAEKRAEAFKMMLKVIGVDMERMKIDNTNSPNYNCDIDDFDCNYSKKYRETKMPARYWNQSAGLILSE